MTKRHRIADIVVKLLIAVFSFGLIFNGWMLTYRAIDYYGDKTIPVSNMLTCIKNKNYEYLLRNVYELDFDKIKDNQDALECYYIAKYFEATSNYKIYKNTDDKKANFYKGKMDEYAGGMGELWHMKDVINEDLKLDKADF